jgi:hypothetical protein
MGGNQVYGPQLPQMPADMSKARNYGLDFMTSNMGGNKAPFDMNYNATPETMDAGALMKFLAGFSGSPNQMTQGGPQAGGKGAPGGGMNLDFLPQSSSFYDTQNMLKEGLNTGFLTDTSNQWNAKKAMYGQTLKDQIAQTWQDNFLGGGRVGTGVANVLGDVTNRAGIGLASEMAPYDTSMIEGAANRRAGLGTLGLGMSQFADTSAQNRAGALGAFGQQKFANQQTMQDKGYQEWLRTQPGYSPLWQSLMQYMTQYPFQGQSPTVATPWWQDLLKGLISGGSSAATAAIIS